MVFLHEKKSFIALRSFPFVDFPHGSVRSNSNGEYVRPSRSVFQNLRRDLLVPRPLFIMLFDLLAVFAVTLISSFVFSTTSVHGYPSSNLHHIPHSPTADLSSSLRLVESDTGGDGFASMFDDRAELPTLRSRKMLLLFEQLEQEDKHRKRSSSTSKQFHEYAAPAAASSMHGSKHSNRIQASDSIRISPSLKNLVEKNPVLQAWLTMLVQKLLEEKSPPYIFKYGRRRK